MSASEQSDLLPDQGTPPLSAAGSGRPERAPDGELIPMWLAMVVLVLLLAVMGVGGYVVRGLVAGDGRSSTPQQIDVREWTRRAQANPNDPRTLLSLGYAYEAAGEYAKSLAEYDAVLKLDPRNSAAYYNRGMVYLKLGQGALAEQSLWHVLSIDKTQALAAKALGEHYASKNQYESVLVAVEPAVAAHPEMADLQYLDGLANEHLGNGALAIRRYRLALTYSPDLVQARDGLKRLGVSAP